MAMFLLAALGAAGLWYGAGAAPEQAEVARQLGNTSIMCWACVGLVWIMKRGVEWFVSF
jgi:hypothetical protein